MNETITINKDETATILDTIEVNIHACNEDNGKAVVMVTEFGQDKLDAVQAGDLLVFHSQPVWIKVLGVFADSIDLLVGQDRVH
jgi:hypothetical protein